MDAFFDYPDGDPDGSRLTFLAGGSDRDWALLREHMQVRQFSAQAVVIASGDTDRALFLVAEGTVEAAPARRTGRESAVPLTAGAVFGELAFLAGRPFPTEVRAVTDARLLRLGLTEFEALAAKDPALGRYVLFDLARLLAERVRDLRALLGQGGR
jgi:CRP-like cAMP-binding protein